MTTVYYCYSIVRMSQLQISTYVPCLAVRNMGTNHWRWFGSTTTRQRMSQYSSMSATWRLHTEILPCNTGHIIGWNVTHFKTLGTTEMWCSMDCELLEIHRWYYDNVRQIFTYRQLHKLINLYIIITVHSVSGITADWLLFVLYCIVNVLIYKE